MSLLEIPRYPPFICIKTTCKLRKDAPILQNLVGPPLSDGCHLGRPSVGIYIGLLLGAQIGMRSPQRVANGWPNKSIVKITVTYRRA